MLKLTIKLDLPCGCAEEHSFDEGEIVYFIENEDKQLDKELFGFWLKQKIGKHLCIASTEDIERYLLCVVTNYYGHRKNYDEYVTRWLADALASAEGKRIE